MSRRCGRSSGAMETACCPLLGGWNPGVRRLLGQPWSPILGGRVWGVPGAWGPKSAQGKTSHSSPSLGTKASAGHRPVPQVGPGSSVGSWDTLTSARQLQRRSPLVYRL